MSSAEVPKFTIVLRKAYAAGYYAMCAPGFEPRATLALPSAFIGAMGPEASVNAVYAGKIAAIEDEDERAAFLAARVEEHRAEVNLLRMGDELVVDAVVARRGPARRADRPPAPRRRLDPHQRAPSPPRQPCLIAHGGDRSWTIATPSAP